MSQLISLVFRFELFFNEFIFFRLKLKKKKKKKKRKRKKNLYIENAKKQRSFHFAGLFLGVG